MKEIEINSWNHFIRQIKKQEYHQWIYRGQSDASWNLESSLLRSMRYGRRLREDSDNYSAWLEHEIHRINDYEDNMLKRFKSCAHLYLSHIPPQRDQLSWLALMQHHGAPTRLLDFSFSPYIALYFALENGIEDSAVYAIDPHAIKKIDDDYFGVDNNENYRNILKQAATDDDLLLYTFEPQFANQRLIAQQGLFVAPNSLTHTHEDVLEIYDLKHRDVVKFIIPKKLRYEGIHLLSQMNINSSTIYPGLDGFCRSFFQAPIFNSRFLDRVGNY